MCLCGVGVGSSLINVVLKIIAVQVSFAILKEVSRGSLCTSYNVAWAIINPYDTGTGLTKNSKRGDQFGKIIMLRGLIYTLCTKPKGFILLSCSQYLGYL